MTRILVVDDDPSLRLLLTEMLTAEGWDCEVLDRGEPVLERLRAQRPDALVLDLVLPDVDGLEILRQIRVDRDLASLPVVLLTGRDEQQDRQAGLVAGADFYLTKPFEPEFLVATLAVVTEA